MTVATRQPPVTTSAVMRLHEAGVSVWLDDLSRPLLDEGTLAGHVAAHGVSGVTCNPTIFARALRGSDRYDDQLGRARSRDPRALYFELALEDVRQAAALLHPTYVESGGRDGYVSFECTPDVAHDARATVRQALAVRRRVPAPNLMVKVPGTRAGMRAIEALTAAGINVNVTLLFTARSCERAARAYTRGMRRRAAAGEDVARVRSAASVFVSRIDAAVDALLPLGASLRGRAGIATALAIDLRRRELLAEPGWRDVAAAGGRPQRALWASTAPKDPAYPDVMYLEALALADSILTVPEPTLLAYADHGSARIAAAAPPDVAGALRELSARGIDLERIGARLLTEGLERFSSDFDGALAEIKAKVARGAARR
jgi:transaldolase